MASASAPASGPDLAQLIRFPHRIASSAASATKQASGHATRVTGSLTESVTETVGSALRPFFPAHSVDDWGRDDHLIRALSPFARLRWDVSVGGDQHLPKRLGALLVTNQRHWSWSPLWVAWALGEATDRPVRFVGRPDIAPLGAALRRLGGLLHEPHEVAGALRHGELVVLGTAPTNHPRHAGVVDHTIVGAAVTTGVPVLPVASMNSILGRGARAEVGNPVKLRHPRRGPLAEVELAEAVQRHLQKLLDQFGGMQTGMGPIDWLGEG